MLWVKAFHIVFAVSWYAGLLYLPRLFVYHASTEDEPGLARFEVMERKLFAIMTVGAVGTIVLGVWLSIAWFEAMWAGGWLYVKTCVVAGLVVYHVICARMIKTFAVRQNIRSQKFYRFFNEIPALALIAIAILVVVKPF